MARAMATPDPLGDQQGIGKRRLRQEDREFLSAVTVAEHVRAAATGYRPGRRIRQLPVADQMPVAVIHRLEVVQVQHQQGQGAAMPPGAFDLAQQVDEGAAREGTESASEACQSPAGAGGG